MLDVARYGPYGGKLRLYVKVGILYQLEQSKFCVLTVTKLGIVMLAVQDDSIFSFSFMYDPGDLLRQTSPDVLSVEEYPVYMEH